MRAKTVVVLCSASQADRFLDSYRRFLAAGLCEVCAAEEAIADEEWLASAQYEASNGAGAEFEGARFLN